MQPVSTFRGSSGEVASDYVSPFTYVSALPVALGLLLLGWISNYFGEYRSYISLPIMSVFVSMATMRFAIPASRGDMEPTNDLAEIISSTGRYLLLNLAWYIPWLIIWKLMAKSAVPPVSLAFMNPMALFQSPWILLFRIVLVFIAIFLPTLCLLITLYSSSTKGLFDAQSWSWLLNQRRADLVTFWSSLIGGGLVMFLCAFLPALILVYLGFKDSPKTGLNIAGFLYLWVIATIPQLNGRLAGAFVAQDFVRIDFVADEPLTIVTETDLPAPVITSRKIESKPDLAEIEQRIAGLENSALAEAMTAASELETSLAAPIRGQIEQMLLHMRHGDSDSARNAAEKAIDSAAQRGFADISMMLFEKLGGDRRKSKLAAYSLEILGNMYQQKKQLLDAAWCFHAAANAAGDPIKAQKRLFQIAEIAETSANYKVAFTLYEILIKQYPDSTLLEFAQQGAARVKNQLG
jgi:tetratricopeptide (TPR) repeat protein